MLPQLALLYRLIELHFRVESAFTLFRRYKLMVVGSVVVACLTALITWRIVAAFGNSQETVKFQSAPIVESLEKMGSVVGLRIQLGDVLEVETEGGAGTFTGVKGAWIIKGDALLSTDLKEAKISANDATKTIYFKLPEPTVLSPRVDHEKTRQYDFKTGWLDREKQSTIHQQAMMRAQQLIETGAGSKEYKKLAKENIELMLTTIVLAAVPDWRAEFTWNTGDDDTPKNKGTSLKPTH